MDPDRIDQMSQQQLDAWAESCLDADDAFDEAMAGLVELDGWAPVGDDRRAVVLDELNALETQLRAAQARQQELLARLSRHVAVPRRRPTTRCRSPRR